MSEECPRGPVERIVGRTAPSDRAFDAWYSMQCHQLSNEPTCRVIWNAAWEKSTARNEERENGAVARMDRIEADASEIIGSMAAVIFGMYVMGTEGSHNGKLYRDIAGELKAAESAAEIRAALGLPPNVI